MRLSDAMRYLNIAKQIAEQKKSNSVVILNIQQSLESAVKVLLDKLGIKYLDIFK